MAATFETERLAVRILVLERAVAELQELLGCGKPASDVQDQPMEEL